MKQTMLQQEARFLTNVPLVLLPMRKDCEAFVLLEKYNLCGSIKVKTVYWMLLTAHKQGLLDPSKELIEASSGNTAIALAFLSSVFGMRCSIVLPTHTAPCKKKLIASYGALVIEKEGSTDDCIIARNELLKKYPDKYVCLDQFTNEANPLAHYHLTAPFLFQKVQLPIDAIFVGLGTAGTIVGIALYVKEHFPHTRVVGINPSEKIEGLRNFKTSPTYIPFYHKHKDKIDAIVDVTFAEAIRGVQKYLDMGYFVGISSGAILAGASKYLQENPCRRVVLIAPDGGDFYLDVLSRYIDVKKFQGCK